MGYTDADNPLLTGEQKAELAAEAEARAANDDFTDDFCPDLVAEPDEAASWIVNQLDAGGLKSINEDTPSDILDLFANVIDEANGRGGRAALVDVVKEIVALGFGDRKTIFEVIADYTKKRAAARTSDQNALDTEHFQFLGYANENGEDTYFLLKKSNSGIYRIDAKSGPRKLLQVAPKTYWARFTLDGQIDWDTAFEFIRDKSLEAGAYQESRVLHRGAILIDDRPIYSDGEALYWPENGKISSKPIGEQKITRNGYFFRALPAAGTPDLRNPMTAEEGREIVDRMKYLFNFDKPEAVDMILGWSLLGPVSGIMEVRPHLDLSGPAKAGKSTIIEILQACLLEETSQMAGGATTAAGIRQTCRDAFPVLFDEAEAKGPAAQKRLNRILVEVCRDAFSATVKSRTLQGSQTGTGREFTFKNSVLMASVNSILNDADTADTSRWLRYEIRQKKREDFRQKLVELRDFIGKGMNGRMIARTLGLSAEILETYQVIFDVLRTRVDNDRQAQRDGFAMTGRWIFCNDHVPTEAEILELVDEIGYRFDEGRKSEPDEVTLSSTIAGIEMELRDANGQARHCTILDALRRSWRAQGGIDALMDEQDPVADIGTDALERELFRRGIRLRHVHGAGFELWVQARHGRLLHDLRETTWGGSYSAVLRRISPTAEIQVKRWRGANQKTVIINWDDFLVAVAPDLIPDMDAPPPAVLGTAVPVETIGKPDGEWEDFVDPIAIAAE
jgi:hypothetical protein|tara:strand:+ start:5864 stop:8065 length:2202 start_codon:yes stop_codon:yes gene_type:complete